MNVGQLTNTSYTYTPVTSAASSSVTQNENSTIEKISQNSNSSNTTATTTETSNNQSVSNTQNTSSTTSETSSQVQSPNNYATLTGEEILDSNPKISKDSESEESNTEGLTESEEEQVEKLKARDQEVKTHEQAHVAAGGQYITGGPHYEYQTGPDGKQYAVGGNVSIDTAPVEGDPQATITKAQVIIKAAMAPAEPSGQDKAVANQARQMMSEAQRELVTERKENSSSSNSSDSSVQESTSSEVNTESNIINNIASNTEIQDKNNNESNSDEKISFENSNNKESIVKEDTQVSRNKNEAIDYSFNITTDTTSINDGNNKSDEVSNINNNLDLKNTDINNQAELISTSKESETQKIVKENSEPELSADKNVDKNLEQTKSFANHLLKNTYTNTRFTSGNLSVVA